MFFHKKRVQKVTCRREQERAQMPDADSLVVEIDLPEGMTAPAELYDLTIEGGGVLVPVDLIGDLCTEDVVQFTLAHPMHGWSVQTPARVVRVVPQGPNHCLLGVQFINTGNLYAQLDDAMGRYFNRRKLGRVHPDENQTIDVHIAKGPNQLLGRIYDISMTGMGLAVPYVQGLELHPDMDLHVKFRLPNSTKTMDGNVRVRQRRMMGEYAFVGVVLGEEFDSSRHLIQDFIENRKSDSQDFEAGFEEEEQEAA